MQYCYNGGLIKTGCVDVTWQQRRNIVISQQVQAKQNSRPTSVAYHRGVEVKITIYNAQQLNPFQTLLNYVSMTSQILRIHTSLITKFNNVSQGPIAPGIFTVGVGLSYGIFMLVTHLPRNRRQKPVHVFTVYRPTPTSFW